MLDAAVCGVLPLNPMNGMRRCAAAALAALVLAAALPAPCPCAPLPQTAGQAEHDCCAPPLSVRASAHGCCAAPSIDAVPGSATTLAVAPAAPLVAVLTLQPPIPPGAFRPVASAPSPPHRVLRI